MNISLRNSVLSCMTICPMLIQCQTKNSCGESWCLSNLTTHPKHCILWISLGVTVMQLQLDYFAETSPRVVLIISWDISGSLQLHWWKCYLIVASYKNSTALAVPNPLTVPNSTGCAQFHWLCLIPLRYRWDFGCPHHSGGAYGQCSCECLARLQKFV